MAVLVDTIISYITVTVPVDTIIHNVVAAPVDTNHTVSDCSCEQNTYNAAAVLVNTTFRIVQWRLLRIR